MSGLLARIRHSLLVGIVPGLLNLLLPETAGAVQTTEGDILSKHIPVTSATNSADDERIQALAHRMARRLLDQTILDDLKDPQSERQRPETDTQIQAVAHENAVLLEESYFKGRYNRSRARLPENQEAWRSRPDIANPGADLANFPNSAFTLPEGRAYIETAPLTYYGPATGQPAQFNTEFLLRYGLTDNIEARIFGNGISWQGGKDPATGFSPVAFDTKIHLMSENESLHLPAVGFEAYIQTTWLGGSAFNQGTTPGFFLNFDQSLPYEIDFEYNLGAAEQMDSANTKAWQFSFQWAFQRDVFNQDLAMFVHGFYNAMTLPRLPNAGAPAPNASAQIQNAIGAGLIWTPGNRLSLWAQSAAGTTPSSPSVISNIGFAVAF